MKLILFTLFIFCFSCTSQKQTTFQDPRLQAAIDSNNAILKRYIDEHTKRSFGKSYYQNGELIYGYEVDLKTNDTTWIKKEDSIEIIREFNLEDFGVIPDDGKEDVTGAQKMIDSARSLPGLTKIIYKPGYYYHPANYILKNNVKDPKGRYIIILSQGAIISNIKR